jgi:hypothetical protein
VLRLTGRRLRGGERRRERGLEDGPAAADPSVNDRVPESLATPAGGDPGVEPAGEDVPELARRVEARHVTEPEHHPAVVDAVDVDVVRPEPLDEAGVLEVADELQGCR